MSVKGEQMTLKELKANNPSKILFLKECLNRGLLTEKEYMRLRMEALKVNVYTGKERQ